MMSAVVGLETRRYYYQDHKRERFYWMLIEDYDFELSTPSCDLSSAVYALKVSLPVDITRALPFINATLKKTEFLPNLPALLWNENTRKYVLRAREIAVSNIADRDEGKEVASEIVERINTVWDNREDVEPSYATTEKPKVLDVFRLLPRTNCGGCGVPSCMAYAAKLAEGKKSLSDCPPLCDAECAGNLASLRELGIE